MIFKKMNPDKGYRNDYLWLPLSKTPNVLGVKNSLTFYRDNEAPICAWEQTATHLIVPREYIPYSRWGDLPYEIEDITPQAFEQLEGLRPLHSLQGPIQHIAFERLLEGGSGVLSLACGLGKTVIALHGWVALGVPALVVVHTEDLLKQWTARILEHTNVRPGDIGWIQGSKMDWRKPIVVAMIHTLAARAQQGELPEGFESYFGLCIFDEVHHLGAPFFNAAAPLCKGTRWGLSATPSRADGLDRLYQMHIGPVLHQHLEQDIIPDCFFIRTGIMIPDDVLSSLRDRTGDLNLAKLQTWLSQHSARNQIILDSINNALLDKRKVLALTARIDHIKWLHGEYPESGAIYGEVGGDERLEALQTKDLIFANTSLAKEGLDRKDLDTLMLLLPITQEGMFRQIIGRIQRKSDGKTTPVFLVFEDERIQVCARMCQKLRHHLTALRYPFSIIKAEEAAEGEE